jgi:PEP-CTERM motif
MHRFFAKAIAGLFVGLVSVNSWAVTIQWANTVSDSTLPMAFPAENALGLPDSTFAGFYDGDAATTEMATFGGFGAGDNVTYDTGSLAALLGVGESLLLQADFISFEVNGSVGLTFETSEWLFSDGTNSLTVAHAIGGSPTGAITALGNVSFAAYDAFFGTTSLSKGDTAYILFDIDGNSLVDPLAPAFTAKLSAIGSIATDSPDPDVMGRILRASPVPEPTTILLLGLGLVGLGFAKRRLH